MAGISDVTITRSVGGLGRVGVNQDGICGLVVTGVAATSLALNTPQRLGSLNQAKGLGINAAYDTTNSTRIYYHLSEFFRLNPNGVIWLMIVAGTNEMVDIADKTNEFAKKLLREAGGEIRALGISTHAETEAGTGLDADVLLAIPLAQALADEEMTEHRPVDIFIEGLGYSGNEATATDLRGLSARDISVVIGQDGSRTDTDDFWASIGAVLGSYSKRGGVNESIGWVAKQNLTSEAQTVFLSAKLSDGTDVKTLSKAKLDTLADKGYIFALSYSGYDGFYWSGSSTCIAVTDDFAVIQNNSVIKKAMRICRNVMLPHIQRPLKVESSTGRLRADMKASFEAEIRQAITKDMAGEFSDLPTLIVDPAYDEDNVAYPAINQDNTLRFIVGIVPDGTAEQITGTIGLQATV